MVLEAYEEFNPQMRKIAEQFFDKNWIDAEVRDGNDSGAFSHSCVPSVHPYILMNYQGKVRDVMTLAHELGHGVHQFLARKQGYLMAQTPLTLAETASVFGEQLTFQKILKNEKDLHKKKFIIANKIEDMINTVVRQIAFLEFEKKIHDHRKIEEISVKKINQYWLEVQMESLGSAFEFDEDYQYYWCYISHFIHSPFYVYSYAFGDCLVNSLYAVYNSQKISLLEFIRNCNCHVTFNTEYAFFCCCCHSSRHCRNPQQPAFAFSALLSMASVHAGLYLVIAIFA
jgi:oligoendopeptidase F